MAKRRANDLDGKQWIKSSISVWDDIAKNSYEKKIDHPSIFPSMLAERLINCFTQGKNNLILDPFMGAGSTIVAAWRTGNRSIGFEINPDYIEIAKERTGHNDLFPPRNNVVMMQNENARFLDEYIVPSTVDLCVTSPPYWNILSQKRSADNKNTKDYSNNHIGGDLSRIEDYRTFILELVGIFNKVYVSLKPKTYLIVNVMDIRKKSIFYPLHSDFADEMEARTDFIFDDLIIWDRKKEYNNLKPLGYPYVFRINKVHEYLLIFKKP